MSNKLFKDEKTRCISLEEFFDDEYITSISKENLWSSKKRPIPLSTYYNFSSSKLTKLYYGFTTKLYGTQFVEYLDSINFAYRDGVTEYKLFNQLIENIKSKNRITKKDKIRIENLEKVLLSIPKYSPPKAIQEDNNYKKYLVDTGYKTNIEEFKNKYIVLDVETNGFRTATDDLLSLTLYDPTTGMCYNRFLPLQMQPIVLTTYINGITTKNAEKNVHITQQELNFIIEYFNLKDKIILSYSGGKGDFDYKFLTSYCKRNKLVGIDDLTIENIKNSVPDASFEVLGQMTKDNLCKVFGIDGVEKVHSGYNDCLLEWKLYEKLKSAPIFLLDDNIYKYNPEYIIPISYYLKSKQLRKYANIEELGFNIIFNDVLKYNFPKQVIRKIKKFSTNITGISVEHAINNALNVQKQDNSEFLKFNKSKLERIGTLKSRINKIPISLGDNGKIIPLNSNDYNFVKEVNECTSIIIDNLTPVLQFIKENIFNSDIIKSQELVLSADNKFLAICDLSDENSILEIKTYNPTKDSLFSQSIATQLYFQSNGRKIYLMSLDYIMKKRNKDFSLDELEVIIYEVKLKKFNLSEYVYTAKLTKNEKMIIESLNKDPYILKKDLLSIINCSNTSLDNSLKRLQNFGYIVPREKSLPGYKWGVLRDVNDDITEFTMIDGNINIIKRN